MGPVWLLRWPLKLILVSFYNSDTVLMCCMRSSPHATRQLSHTNWMSYNLTHFSHYQPRDSIRCHRLRAQSYKTVPTSDTSHKDQL